MEHLKSELEINHAKWKNGAQRTLTNPTGKLEQAKFVLKVGMEKLTFGVSAVVL